MIRAEVRDRLAHAYTTGDFKGLDDLLASADISSEDIPREVKHPYELNPITEQFHASDAQIRGLLSCYGGGTSTAVIMDLVLSYPQTLVAPQVVAQGLNTVNISAVAIRQTYGELRKSFVDIFTRSMPPYVRWDWKFGQSKFVWEYKRNGIFYKGTMECWGLDTRKDIAKLGGLPISYVIISEPDGIDPDIIAAVMMRAGRGMKYQPKRIVIEGNPPNPQHGVYRYFGGPVTPEVEGLLTPTAWMPGKKDLSPRGHCQTHIDATTGKEAKCWWYPSGMSENAFFAKFHATQHPPDGRGYYADMDKHPLPLRRPYQHGMMGSVAKGDVIFERFSEATNVAQRPHIFRGGEQLVLAADPGRTGACLIAIVRDDGGLLVVDEVTAGGNGADIFGYEIAEKLGAMKFHKIVAAVLDPAGTRRMDDSERQYANVLSDKVTQELRRKVVFKPLPKKFNDVEFSFSQANAALFNAAPRHGGMGTPMVQIAPNCGDTIYALSNYCWKEGVEKMTPDKANAKISGLGDAFKYLACFWRGGKGRNDLLEEDGAPDTGAGMWSDPLDRGQRVLPNGGGGTGGGRQPEVRGYEDIHRDYTAHGGGPRVGNSV